MQRLFSTFPTSWPGLGLLLLRVTVGAQLPTFLANAPDDFPIERSTAVRLGTFALASLLIVGAATPVVAVLIVIALSAAFLFGLPSGTLYIAGAALSLALIGPGAWSIDAYLFGRRIISVSYDRPPE